MRRRAGAGPTFLFFLSTRSTMERFSFHDSAFTLLSYQYPSYLLSYHSAPAHHVMFYSIATQSSQIASSKINYIKSS
jgi:hypothetical protein